MAISVFDIFKIGIGPSSSHTVGPMRATRMFARRLQQQHLLDRCTRIEIQLYGSLAATGKGHGSDKAILLGLLGEQPESIAIDSIAPSLHEIREQGKISILGQRTISFQESRDVHFCRQESLPFHSNGMRCSAFDMNGTLLETRCYYSVGGGFVISDTLQEDEARQKKIVPDTTILPIPFHCAKDLLQQTHDLGCSIAEIMYRNEQHWRTRQEIQTQLMQLWEIMQACVTRGCHSEGVLPGGFKVKRRAPSLFKKLSHTSDHSVSMVSHIAKSNKSHIDPLQIMDWVNLFALAVNEENASAGKIITAPTNGAAGIIPAILHYYHCFTESPSEEGIGNFLLTAAAIGILYKENASISGAEVGCQGEVGVACSMAAAGLCSVFGGTPEQIENAAEIAMEHHLGLTCDPVGGLVQIPCIERNAIAAVKGINAARMAMYNDGQHFVTLDQVIKTMRETGKDMQEKYKETSRGGLAVNIIEC